MFINTKKEHGQIILKEESRTDIYVQRLFSLTHTVFAVLTSTPYILLFICISLLERTFNTLVHVVKTDQDDFF